MNFKRLPLPPVMDSEVDVADFVAFTEGPAVDADGTVFYSDIRGNRILKMTREGRHSVFRYPRGRTNGQVFDQQGRLWHCEGNEFGRDGHRRITRTDFTKPDQPEVIMGAMRASDTMHLGHQDALRNSPSARRKPSAPTCVER